jgi:hypothetical protein
MAQAVTPVVNLKYINGTVILSRFRVELWGWGTTTYAAVVINGTLIIESSAATAIADMTAVYNNLVQGLNG